MAESEEFSLFYLDGETRIAMKRDEYILDVTTFLKERGLDPKFVCLRTTWVHPLDSRSSVLYINTLYAQVHSIIAILNILVSKLVVEYLSSCSGN